ncbi:DUF6279 family lipoprotein [Turneriella parva]|uniref:Lipoprotein n=1 Tax=Turneriella parva (strain ATCC BAA-1111 / DSM 21527 / NCTC 11395 / H) TaxID=869212 RepID=I4B547_TURPD|nr:DUF6279 family lipoprotein [Turneriella parva]AFM12404.1 hypothetical protein Turpa_1757 [Turneriella parva DSM 21527]
MRRRLRLTLLFAFVLSVACCTRALGKVAYNNLLPQIILNRIDEYFDLNSTQEKYLKARLQVHHAWHRTTQLKLYGADLKDLRSRLAATLTEADLLWLTDRLTRHRNAIYARIIPDLVNVLQTLSDDQLNHFQKKLDKENRELDEKLARPLSVRQQEEFQAIVKQIEEWTGSLTKLQKDMLRTKYVSIADSAVDWLRYREDQQGVFVRLLRSKPDHQTLKADLEGRMIYQERNVPQRFKVRFQRTLTLLKEMALTADKTLTPDQRMHALAKMDEYIQLVEEISPR